MAGETTVATLVGWYQTQLLSKAVAPYAKDPIAAVYHCRAEQVPQGTDAYAFSTETKDTALSTSILESTGLANTAYDTTKASATVAEYGVLRQSTKKAEKTNMLGGDGLLERFLIDGSFLCYEKMETDAWAEFTNASTSVGTAGQAMKYTDLGLMVAQHTVNKSVGELVGFLHASAMKNVRQDILGAGAALLSTGIANGLLGRGRSDGFQGHFMMDLYSGNLGLASGADKISAAMVSASLPGNDPVNCPIGLAISWLPEASPVWKNPTFSGGNQVAITACVGYKEIVDFPYVKQLSIA